jgi:GTP-binding protein
MSKVNDAVPVVAIVGKPNVGKSSIFNRLIGRRKAIVAEEPGVTRDINYETIEINGKTVKLADSAGYSSCSRSRAGAHPDTAAINENLIKQASLILLVCEPGGPDAEDFSVARKVRRSGKPCILVVNKIDSEKTSYGISDFFELGFENPIAVSASHGTNFETLERSIEEKIASDGAFTYRAPSESGDPEAFPVAEDAEPLRVAIVGKPNVGKSSLLNLFAGSERSLVSPEPGTTRDAVDETIEYRGHLFTFVDTAGIRRRSQIRENVEYYSILRAEKALSAARIAVQVIDAEQGITHQDKRIAYLAVGGKKGLVIAVNKWDRVQAKGARFAAYRTDLLDAFPHVFFAKMVPVSAKTGYNKIKLLNSILDVINNYNLRVKTSDLNSLARVLSLQGVRVKYGYQRSVSPPVFEFFLGGNVKNVENFKKFVVNSIRKRFGFEGVPMEVRLRKD